MTSPGEGRDVDVVVVGAGGGGLTAAIAAAEAGASVALLEKLDRPGGNTYVSTGSIPAAGTRYQRAAGVEDVPERMAADLLRQSGAHDAEHLVRLLAGESAGLVEWLVEEHGVDLRLITDYRHVGHSVPRLHAPPDRRGASLVRDLVAAAGRLGVEVVAGNPVAGLLTEDDAVTGVRVSGERSGDHVLRAGAVVLAANGFGNNKKMIERWLPEAAATRYLGAEGSTGEAVEWAEALGARLLNMGAYQGYAAVAYPHGSIVSWTTVEKGGFLLAPDGSRIGDESVGYSGFAAEVARRTEQSWVVFDTRIRDFVAGNEPEFADLVAFGGVKEADGAEGIARVIGCSPEAVEKAVAGQRQAAESGGADVTGRSDFPMGPLREPYCCVRSVPALFHTQGGVDVGRHAQVVRENGRPVRGLYAVGGVTGGLSGREGARGYSSGNGLLSAVGLGRLAGASAALA
ncbi:FAD-dependent oxidoreductase [Streptomyces sp. DSM 42041]|uniref:FAD-dependent oxidoreductase n=1 Tax=Streptomyces hazeniae TaxID=3075538 RepID=A0ABU2NPA8_9ACTN|nr:FAD-dependent oxidoreductase [Streptomyces sp. DSM 42041]MDT0377852.1 FAD-dependent oxidoreductase [Streptomyces sp. DSM 42041]